MKPLREVEPGAKIALGISFFVLFFAVWAAATLGGVALCFTPMDPVRELFWSAVINGVIAVPIMTVMMLLATRHAVMGEHVIGRRLRRMGWAATTAMCLTVLALGYTTLA